MLAHNELERQGETQAGIVKILVKHEGKKNPKLSESKIMKACKGEILDSPSLNAFRGRKIAAKKGKNVDDTTTDNLLVTSR